MTPVEEARKAAREAARQVTLSWEDQDDKEALTDASITLDAAIDAYESRFKELGFVLVPREATREMKEKLLGAMGCVHVRGEFSDRLMVVADRALRAAISGKWSKEDYARMNAVSQAMRAKQDRWDGAADEAARRVPREEYDSRIHDPKDEGSPICPFCNPAAVSE